MNKYNKQAGCSTLVNLVLTRSHFCSSLNHNNENKKHPKEYLWEPSFSNRISPYRLFHTRTDGHKTLGKHKSLMRCLCPLVTRCNFVKVIKLNKYDLSNSKWIEKVAAFGLSFLKKNLIRSHRGSSSVVNMCVWGVTLVPVTGCDHTYQQI